MTHKPCLRLGLGAAAALAGLLVNLGSVLAVTAFRGVAAGDMSASDAILWTRTFDPTTGQPVTVAMKAAARCRAGVSYDSRHLPGQD